LQRASETERRDGCWLQFDISQKVSLVQKFHGTIKGKRNPWATTNATTSSPTIANLLLLAMQMSDERSKMLRRVNWR
jgi:hypothetical protein